MVVVVLLVAVALLVLRMAALEDRLSQANQRIATLQRQADITEQTKAVIDRLYGNMDQKLREWMED